MTDEDIIKAMVCCTENKCSQCPLSDEICSEKDVIKEAIALITRQQDEINRYKCVIKILESDKKIDIDALSRFLNYIRSDKNRVREESIREFSQLIVDKIDSGLITDSSDIDDYVEDYLDLRSKYD